ncbi:MULTISPECIES: glycosyltransferase family 52 [unclassified Lentimonas]|uniref:glycosyltransferase family 52 n=1 Tax=unclassified Lentimonas TaxID=2630993 RepID=UPI0013247DE0|nr:MULTISPECIES: glycosyltransferase family 52 [unclassified Lentimonas]CAA6676539.1 Unannotated [Lentimonas sp. CC4]CAA6685379.1 Unannotated [Lentimonas sp. CC6]CAA7074897.1 Unannotated [Lentimonas sp. CC4]CAA7169522.1 Unannotated [Lentimonas sp. CC21]CAA7182717.1 Unannotated [Lentimonas sp. CC8]
MRFFRKGGRRKHTLFLLRSPLQAYITYNIVKQYGLPSPLVLYLSLKPSPKEERYYSLMRSISVDGVFIQLGNHHFASVFKEWRKIATLLGWIVRREISIVILANVWLWCFRVIAQWCGASVATMDDGSLNYSSESQLKWLRDRDQKLWLSRLFLSYSTEELCRVAVRHYALRPDLCHTFGPEPVAVTLGNSRNSRASGGKLNIFLGQPFEKVYDPDVVKNFLRAYHQIGGIYFPHPRERQRPFETIDSPLIIEEFVAAEERELRVFGLFSTALITIQGAEKFYFDLDGNQERREIMERVGCTVLVLSDIDEPHFL